MKIFTTLLLLLIPFLQYAQAPNIIFILADDMGWTGTSVQISPTYTTSASDFYETPNLQRLADEGMTFSQAYAPASKCSPTRCSILTGESPARNSYTNTSNPSSAGSILLGPETIRDIPGDDITIAEWLKSTGLNYQTAHYGKWHMSGTGPDSHGFDDSDGNTSNNDGNAVDGNTIQDDPKKIMELTNKGIAFMEDAVENGVPFYIQISHYAVHGVVESTQESFNYFDAKAPGELNDDPAYGGMTKDLDDGVGLILDAIEDLQISEETYVIFLSDNGAGGLSNNTPLNRGKGTIFEGGIRVPFFVKGPNISASSTSSTPVNGYDLYPTIAEWTGSETALPSTLDGKSIVPILTQNVFTRDEPLYFHLPHYTTNGSVNPRSALVEGDYKLIVEYETGIDYLYNLGDEIGELTNIASINPDLTNELKIKLRDYLKSVDTNMPTINPDHDDFSGMDPDIDEDGLEDDWEFRELLTHIYGPNDDPDQDGDDNLTEYNNGTDPLSDEMITGESPQPNITSISAMRLFPNPTNDHLNIDFSLTQAFNMQLVVTDLSGKILMNKEWNANQGEQQVLVHTHHLNQGCYLLHLIGPEWKKSGKFVIGR